MSDELKPALSAEEWAKGSVHSERDYIDWQVHPQSDVALYVGDESDTVHVSHTALPAMIALANAALPADSPYKITQHDVFLCRQAWSAEGREPDDPMGALAAKLAALLPPE